MRAKKGKYPKDNAVHFLCSKKSCLSFLPKGTNEDGTFQSAEPLLDWPWPLNEILIKSEMLNGKTQFI